MKKTNIFLISLTIVLAAAVSYLFGAASVAIQNGPYTPHKLRPRTKSYKSQPHKVKTKVIRCRDYDYDCHNQVLGESLNEARAKRSPAIRDKKANNGNKKIKSGRKIMIFK